MESLFIEGTKKTPQIDFKTTGYLAFKGRSIPEDPIRFYENVFRWIEKYSKNPQPITHVDIEFEYFNSGTSKSLLHILKLLASLSDKGSEVKFRWIYESGDEDIYERGEYYSSLIDYEFEFVEIKNEE